jgi:hypothetical protein
MKLLGLIASCAFGCGSQSLSPAAARIHEGTELELTDCAVLQRVNGSAPADDANAETTAKNAAREAAAKLGATHIRWIVPCCTYVEANAYRCDAPE